MKLVVTGGAGFIGSNFVRHVLREHPEDRVVNLDKLTYAGNLGNLAALEGDARHRFVRGDIGDGALVGALLAQHRPRAIVNFAAESHVDRSIHEPAEFIATNVAATFSLLETVRAWWSALPAADRSAFRLVHISTDEVYGSLGPDDPPFSETTPYAPNSPYSASKAASDHLVRAWHHTYGLPVVTTNCSNNYGPRQFPEKLIPLMIVNALAGKPLPVYGDGGNVRDWLYVGDHCDALATVFERGRAGETYLIGGRNEWRNLDLVREICRVLDDVVGEGPDGGYGSLITFVTDRLGHDARYAIDPTKIESELGWRAAHSFEDGLRETVRWYCTEDRLQEKAVS